MIGQLRRPGWMGWDGWDGMDGMGWDGMGWENPAAKPYVTVV